jgi:hypothetical protein
MVLASPPAARTHVKRSLDEEKKIFASATASPPGVNSAVASFLKSNLKEGEV